MPHPDGVPTREELLAEEEECLKNAISVNHGFGMDLQALVAAAMKHLKGRANAAEVARLAKNYLENGHRFK